MQSQGHCIILIICNPIGDERGVIQGSRCRLVSALRFRHAEPKAVAGVNVGWYLKSMNCVHKISWFVQILALKVPRLILVCGVAMLSKGCERG